MAATEYFGETAVQPRYHVPVNTMPKSHNHTLSILGDPGAVSRAGRKGATKVFKHRRKSPWVPKSHWTISKRSRECWFLIGHKKCFVLFCPIGEQHLESSFREFVHDSFYLRHICPIRSPSLPNQKRRNYR